MKLPAALGALMWCICCSTTTRADSVAHLPAVVCDEAIYVQPEQPSWVFRRSTYSHDPYTGARVAQYMRTPPVEPLDDERMVTSRFRRSRTNIRGMDGSLDSYYEVQQWGSGRGGLDAEWERFHDAWQDSFLQGGWHNQGPWFGPPQVHPGLPGTFVPGHGFAPSHGFPGHGVPRHPFPSHGFGRPPHGIPPGYHRPPHGHGFHGHRGRHGHIDGP